MAVLEQITEVSDKFFDVATKTNDKAHDRTKDLVTKIQDSDRLTPLTDKLGDIDLPLKDKFADIYPEPLEAVDSYFGFIGKGIEANRKFTSKAIDRLRGEEDVIDVSAKEEPSAPAKKAPVTKTATAKETAAKKTATKKAPAKKAATAKKAPVTKTATAKETAAKKTTAKKAPTKKG